MTLKLRNTLTRALEPFEPRVAGQVGVYVCGPTVYDYFHVGNARPFVVFDVLRRYLEHLGYAVTFVQNITDIDDKIINRARDEGTTSEAVAERFSQAYREDVAALGVRPATHQPTATGHVQQIIALIQTLEQRGLTYTQDGDVYYRVAQFAGYGKLSGKKLEDLRLGASGRTEAAHETRKEHPADFALWKAQKLPDEPAWDSPWGKGRPGWHIECSAMSQSFLGTSFDIHAGGEDLTFPHHENEIAQSEGASGEPYARYWLHNAYLNVAKEETPLTAEQQQLVAQLELAVKQADAERKQRLLDELAAQNVYVLVDPDGALQFKGSKSLGNVPRVREIFARGFGGEVVRFFLLRAHYRAPLAFSWGGLQEAKTALARWAEARHRLTEATARGDARGELGGAADAAAERFTASMDDDLNTAGAIGAAFELIAASNRALEQGAASAAEVARASEVLDTIQSVLGVSFPAAEALSAEEQALFDGRAAARAAKQWAESDRLRDELLARGVQVRDTPEGQTWTRT
ncbi:MAG: cysteine--tRNA ligase [Planctomycetes bacterium]|nr:cysteine--tRNA ligase [Planctomycetota bacterium]